ncbi:MAG: hypothetical protein WAW41_09285, partial [Methylobacter sp.]
VLLMALSGALIGSISSSALADDGNFEAKKPVTPAATTTAKPATPAATTVKPTVKGEYKIGGFTCGVNDTLVSCDNSTGLSFNGKLSGTRIQIDYGDIITLFDGLGCCDDLDVNLVGSDVLVDSASLVAEMKR